jgi:histone deacetylase HOS2
MVIPPDLQGIRDDVEKRLKEEREEKDGELRRVREEGVGQPGEF